MNILSINKSDFLRSMRGASRKANGSVSYFVRTCDQNKESELFDNVVAFISARISITDPTVKIRIKPDTKYHSDDLHISINESTGRISRQLLKKASIGPVHLIISVLFTMFLAKFGKEIKKFSNEIFKDR